MTPPGGRGLIPGVRGLAAGYVLSADIGRLHCCAGGELVAEELLDAVPPLFYPGQWQPEVRDGVADRVVGLVPGDRDEQRPLVRARLEAAAGELFPQGLGALLDSDHQD